MVILHTVRRQGPQPSQIRFSMTAVISEHNVHYTHLPAEFRWAKRVGNLSTEPLDLATPLRDGPVCGCSRPDGTARDREQARA